MRVYQRWRRRRRRGMDHLRLQLIDLLISRPSRELQRTWFMKSLLPMLRGATFVFSSIHFSYSLPSHPPSSPLLPTSGSAVSPPPPPPSRRSAVQSVLGSPPASNTAPLLTPACAAYSPRQSTPMHRSTRVCTNKPEDLLLSCFIWLLRPPRFLE